MSTLLLNQAVSPSCLQAFVGLDNILQQLVSLIDNERLCSSHTPDIDLLYNTIVDLTALLAVLLDLQDF